MTQQPTIYTPHEVAELMKCHVDYVYMLINTNALKASNVGSGKSRPRWRVEQKEIDDFLSRRRKETKKRASVAPVQFRAVKQYV